MEKSFNIIPASAPLVPIIISVPHCGVNFPEDIRSQYNQDLIQNPDDTDWFVHDLYNFATEMGITIIHANYSRWVIDLNRDPDSAPLYNDGRIITGLTPTTDFFGKKIYSSSENEPNQAEVDERLKKYYWTYYNAIENLIEERKQEFGKVVLWDAHSIRRHVPTIRKDFFPDMILGNNDEMSADKSLIETALSTLRKGDFQVNHNTPFKGGHITRYFGKPNENVHALQLEMNKILYMDDDELKFNENRANQVRSILRPVFENLIEQLKN